VVTDLEPLVAFYTAALGAVETRRLALPADTNAAMGLGGAATMVFLTTPGGEQIKLIRPERSPGDGTPLGPLFERQGTTWITIYLDDATAALERALACGGRQISDPAIVRNGPKHITVVADPEGNPIEIVDEGTTSP
jgi:catechol 2,3-dioxygenase-like lactoylglutathione lyase family enzyme